MTVSPDLSVTFRSHQDPSPADEPRLDSIVLPWANSEHFYRYRIYKVDDQGNREQLSLTEREWKTVFGNQMEQTLKKVSDAVSDFLPGEINQFGLHMDDSGIDVAYSKGKTKAAKQTLSDFASRSFFGNIMRLNPMTTSSLKIETERVGHYTIPARETLVETFATLAHRIDNSETLQPRDFQILLQFVDGQLKNNHHITVVLPIQNLGQLAKIDTSEKVPIVLPIQHEDGRLALLYYTPGDSRWHYFDPSGAAKPKDKVWTNAMKKLGIVNKKIAIDPKDDARQPQLSLLAKIFQIVDDNDDGTKTDLLPRELQEFFSHAQIELQTTPPSNPLKTSYESLAPDKVPNWENLKAINAPAREPAPQTSKAEISIFDSSVIDAIWSARQESLNPIVFDFACQTDADHPTLLQMSTPLAQIDNLSVANSKYISDVPLLRKGEASQYAKLRDGEEPPTFAIGFSQVPKLGRDSLRMHSKTGVPVSLEPAVKTQLQASFRSLLHTAKVKGHNVLIIPEAPLSGDLNPEERRFIDEQIAALFMALLRREFSEQDWQLLFALSGKDKGQTRHPVASYYTQFSAGKSGFAKVARLNAQGMPVAPPKSTKIRGTPPTERSAAAIAPPTLVSVVKSKPLGIKNEGDDCFISAYLQAFVLDDPEFMEALKDEVEIGDFIRHYQASAGGPVNGIHRIRQAISKNKRNTKYKSGQHDPTEALGFLHEIKTGHTQTETTRHYWKRPTHFQSNEKFAAALGGHVDGTEVYTESQNTDFNGYVQLVYNPRGVLTDMIESALTAPHNGRDLQLDAQPTVRIEGLKKKTTWKKAPEYFIFGVGAPGGNLNSAVKLPLTDVPPTISPPGLDGQTYELTSFIRHVGRNGAGGHYVAYVKRGEKYYECNDDLIKEIDQATFATQVVSAYCLKYTRSN